MDAVELIDDPDSELIDVIIISDPEFGSDLWQLVILSYLADLS